MMSRLSLSIFLFGAVTISSGCSHAPPQALTAQPEARLSYAADDAQAATHAGAVCSELGRKLMPLGVQTNSDGTKVVRFKCV